MDVHIRKADLKMEISEIMRQDRLIFPVDAYDSQGQWEGVTCYWLIVDGEKIGTIGFAHDVDVDRSGDVTESPGNCCIETTGVLLGFRGKGLGKILKAYEMAYAIEHGFKRISTTCRKSNAAIIGLNELFGLERVYEIPGIIRVSVPRT